MALQLPTVIQATTGQLDPLQALSGVTIKIRYAHMTVQENITLHWTGTAMGSVTIGPLRGDPRGEIEFTLVPDVVGANIGPSQRVVQVRYDVDRLGGGAQQSPVLGLGIRPLAGLAQPVIAGAAGSTLDLDRVSGNPAVSVAPWNFARAGQRVWLRCHGTKLNGEPDLIELVSAGALDEGEAASGLSRVLGRDRLLLLRDDSEFRVEFKVSFDQTQQEADAVTFPLLRLTLCTGLSIAPELLVLDGPAIRVTKIWQQIRDFPGNTAQRQATAADETLLLGHYAQPFPALMRRYFFMFTNGQCPGAVRIYEVGSANTFRCDYNTINAGGWFLTRTKPAG